MTKGLTRRGLLAGGISAFAGLAWAEAPLVAPRPPLRRTASAAAPIEPSGMPPEARAELDELIRRAGLEGKVSVALVDVDDGTVIAAHDAGEARPPASVAKALTALYALDTLGAGHRFATRLLATAPVVEGRIDGDLILAGGGDPTLSTDRLAELAMQLAAAGVQEVGAFRVWGGALPELREISPEQMPHLDYNPAVSGLNLNYNRVFFEWARSGGGYRVAMTARGEEDGPAVTIAQMRVADRSGPVYTYTRAGDADLWTVARGQLGDGGNRWLPVRSPAVYAGQALIALAREQGIALPPPSRIDGLPEGLAEVARVESAPLDEILTEMMLYSTNLTAEVVGLAATVARGLEPGTPADSAAAMNDWLREVTGARVRLVDHSGLGSRSRVAASEMAVALASHGVVERLRPLMRNIALTGADGEALDLPPALVRAKTGTLNFVSALAGYARTRAGTDLAFAIFSADLEARAAADEDDEVPEGSRDFLARSRRLQQVLLQRWGLLTV